MLPVNVTADIIIIINTLNKKEKLIIMWYTKLFWEFIVIYPPIKIYYFATLLKFNLLEKEILNMPKNQVLSEIENEDLVDDICYLEEQMIGFEKHIEKTVDVLYKRFEEIVNVSGSFIPYGDYTILMQTWQMVSFIRKVLRCMYGLSDSYIDKFYVEGKPLYNRVSDLCWRCKQAGEFFN